MQRGWGRETMWSEHWWVFWMASRSNDQMDEYMDGGLWVDEWVSDWVGTGRGVAVVSSEAPQLLLLPAAWWWWQRPAGFGLVLPPALCLSFVFPSSIAPLVSSTAPSTWQPHRPYYLSHSLSLCVRLASSSSTRLFCSSLPDCLSMEKRHVYLLTASDHLHSTSPHPPTSSQQEETTLKYYLNLKNK